jgi:histidyl-tRNA synthetase
MNTKLPTDSASPEQSTTPTDKAPAEQAPKRAPESVAEKTQTQVQPVRGTRDLLFDECQNFRYIENLARSTAALFGFHEIETPLIESSAVFKRSLGTTSDIVTKEMYCFRDLGGDELVLRPEGTAGIARAFISEGLTQHTPLKLFYSGPMFRYERPQKGRYRQFYQTGVEILGVEKPQAEIEILALAAQFLTALKLKGSLVLHINTIGDQASRASYREKLVTYLSARRSELSPESQLRLEKNPLRILDSKDEGDRRVLVEAPSLETSLNDESRRFFDQILAGLELLKIPYMRDPLLVRGLDYYCHSVFEFTTDALGAQNAVLAGGRYDGLIHSLGGPMTPGVGWAAGTDRLSLMVDGIFTRARPVAVIPMGPEAEAAATVLCQRLRLAGHAADMGYSGNMSKRMKRAAKLGARYALILGSDELSRNVVQLKDLDLGEQREVALSGITEEIV